MEEKCRTCKMQHMNRTDYSGLKPISVCIAKPYNCETYLSLGPKKEYKPITLNDVESSPDFTNITKKPKSLPK